jgi:hypothetical protein
MSFKNISTVLLIIAATALLTTLALKVRICTTIGPEGKGQAGGCCGGCASGKKNLAKGESK